MVMKVSKQGFQGAMAAATAATALVGMSDTAEASYTVKFCNRTDKSISMAAAEEVDSFFGKTATAAGWYGMKPGECSYPITWNSSARVWFAFVGAKDDGYPQLKFGSKEAIKAKGGQVLDYICTDPNGPFQFKRANLQALGENCPSGWEKIETSIGYNFVMWGNNRDHQNITLDLTN